MLEMSRCSGVMTNEKAIPGGRLIARPSPQARPRRLLEQDLGAVVLVARGLEGARISHRDLLGIAVGGR